MLFLLQLILFVLFIITFLRLTFDVLYNALLIVCSLLIIAFCYAVKLWFRTLRICRRFRDRRRAATAFRFARFQV